MLAQGDAEKLRQIVKQGSGSSKLKQLVSVYTAGAGHAAASQLRSTTRGEGKPEAAGIVSWDAFELDDEAQWARLCVRLFDACDEDGDGQLDRREFLRIVKMLGVHTTDAEIAQAFDGADADRNTVLDFNEFSCFLVSIRDKLQRDENGEQMSVARLNTRVEVLIAQASPPAEHVCTQFATAWRVLMRDLDAVDESGLSAIAREAQQPPPKGLGVDILNGLLLLERPLRESRNCYDGAYEELRESDAQLPAVVQLADVKAGLDCRQHLPHDRTPLSSEEDLDALLHQGTLAQQQLTKIVGPDVAWQQGKWMGGLAQGLPGEAMDPGIKGRERCLEKAKFKYGTPDGGVDFGRLRDISRLAVRVKSCAELLDATEWMRKHFRVFQLENRFSSPTPLGWRDVTMLLGFEVEHDGRRLVHVSEVQLQLVRLAEAREVAHEYYGEIRSLLPKACRSGAELGDRVQQFVLDRLCSPAVRNEIFEHLGFEVTPMSNSSDAHPAGSEANMVLEYDQWGAPWAHRASKKPIALLKLGRRVRDDDMRFPVGASACMTVAGGVMVRLPPWVQLTVASKSEIELVARGVTEDGREYKRMTKMLPIAHSVMECGAKVFVSAYLDSLITEIAKFCQHCLGKGCQKVELHVSESGIVLGFATQPSKEAVKDKCTTTFEVLAGFALEFDLTASKDDLFRLELLARKGGPGPARDEAQGSQADHQAGRTVEAPTIRQLLQRLVAMVNEGRRTPHMWKTRGLRYAPLLPDAAVPEPQAMVLLADFFLDATRGDEERWALAPQLQVQIAHELGVPAARVLVDAGLIIGDHKHGTPCERWRVVLLGAALALVERADEDKASSTTPTALYTSMAGLKRLADADVLKMQSRCTFFSAPAQIVRVAAAYQIALMRRATSVATVTSRGCTELELQLGQVARGDRVETSTFFANLGGFESVLQAIEHHARDESVVRPAFRVLELAMVKELAMEEERIVTLGLQALRLPGASAVAERVLLKCLAQSPHKQHQLIMQIAEGGGVTLVLSARALQGDESASELLSKMGAVPVAVVAAVKMLDGGWTDDRLRTCRWALEILGAQPAALLVNLHESSPKKAQDLWKMLSHLITEDFRTLTKPWDQGHNERTMVSAALSLALSWTKRGLPKDEFISPHGIMNGTVAIIEDLVKSSSTTLPYSSGKGIIDLLHVAMEVMLVRVAKDAKETELLLTGQDLGNESAGAVSMLTDVSKKFINFEGTMDQLTKSERAQHGVLRADCLALLEAYLEKVPGSVRQAHGGDTDQELTFAQVFLALVNDLADKETKGTVQKILKRVHPPPKRTSKVLEQEIFIESVSGGKKEKVKSRKVRFELKCPICAEVESTTETFQLKEVERKGFLKEKLDEWADEMLENIKGEEGFSCDGDWYRNRERETE